MPAFFGKLAAAAVALTIPAGALDFTELPPPKLEFVGKAPKFKVFPGGGRTKNSTWIMLEFGNIQELGPGGEVIENHAVHSLAAAQPTFVESDVILHGVSARMVSMSLDLSFDTSDCPGACEGKKVAAGKVIVKTFIFSADAEIPYDNYTISVMKGQMKFNFEAERWPFCGKDHSLMVAMAVTIPSDETGKPPKLPKEMKQRPPPQKPCGGESPRDRRERVRPKGCEFTADAGEGTGVALDLPEVVIVDSMAADMSVEQDSTGGKTVVKFTFPHFESTLLYDPSVGFALAEDATDDTTKDSVAPVASGSAGDATKDSAVPVVSGSANLVTSVRPENLAAPASSGRAGDAIGGAAKELEAKETSGSAQLVFGAFIFAIGILLLDLSN